jgi:LytR cell envelope-related transcriptional attenuator
MHLIRDVGAYAGFAAVIGLGILSALYFSQARDVKRLREWAGRAPERTAQQQADIAARATPRPAQPTTAAPVTPATPKEPAPVPAAAAAKPVPAGNTAPAPAPAVAKAPAPSAQPAAVPAAASAVADKEGEAAVAEAPARTAAPAAKPTQPAAPPRAPARTTVLPPTMRVPPPSTGGRWPAPRYIALIVVGVLVIGGGMAYGVRELVRDQPSSSQPAAGGAGGETKAAKKRPAINPSTITVSVLNGTTVPGLAAQFADKAEAAGFQRGNTANFTDQSKAESVVLYADGASRAARAVANRLGISQIEPIDSRSQALAGDATVVVVVGADQTQ